jgi:hypothetical protein
MEPHLRYPRELSPELMTKLVAVAGEGPDNRLPTQDEVGRLLDIAWAATILEEEGRRTTFALVFEQDGKALENDYDVTYFSKARPCTPGAVAKLAPATNVRETVIGVRQAAAGGFEIWGLVHFGDRTIDIDVPPILPTRLLVRGLRPGSLSVDCGAEKILLYTSGDVHWHSRDNASITSLLREALHSATALPMGTSGGSLAVEFERLAVRMIQAGHGGTLLIEQPLEGQGPSGRPSNVHIPAEGRFQPPNTILQEAFLRDHALKTPGRGAQLKPDETKANQGFKIPRKHRDALDHVARLANVDGAVVMGPDLTVYGFGATIEMPSGAVLENVEVENPNAVGGARRRLTGGENIGHRHKSAYYFCAGQTGLAVAIVVSQDRTLSLAARMSDGSVRVLKPLVLQRTS